MIDKNIFIEQLNNLEKYSKDFDLLAARYNPIYKNTAMHVEKLDLGFNITKEKCLNLFDNLKSLNEDNYNIYIRPSNYRDNSLLVLDDFIDGNSSLTHGIMKDYIFERDLFSFDFALQTSFSSSQNKTVDYNYQLGVILNEKINPRHKQFLLTAICENLDCDAAHANISKFFRVAGFFNRKYNKVENSLEIAQQKNIPIKYTSLLPPSLCLEESSIVIPATQEILPKEIIFRGAARP